MKKIKKIDKRTKNYKEGYNNGVISGAKSILFVNTDQYHWITKKMEKWMKYSKGKSTKSTLTLKKLNKLYQQAKSL